MATTREVQIAWFDVTHRTDESGPQQDWEINSYEDIDQSIERYKDHIRLNRGMIVTTDEARILREYSDWLKTTRN